MNRPEPLLDQASVDLLIKRERALDCISKYKARHAVNQRVRKSHEKPSKLGAAQAVIATVERILRGEV